MKDERMESYRRSRQAATDWLLAQQATDGEIAETTTGPYYYRLPWAYSLLGRPEASAKLLAWIKGNAWSDGGLNDSYPVGPLAKHYSYILSNIVIGAQVGQRFDISVTGLSSLRRYQDSWSGAFRNAREDLTPHEWAENWTSAQIGMAFLMAGDISTAVQVGAFLVRAWDGQPDLPKRLYFVYDCNARDLVTSSTADPRTYTLDAQEARQWFWAPGLVAAYLGMLSIASGDSKYLEYAQRYQDFVQQCTDKQFDGIEVCKTAWGASVLYRLTGKQEYLEWATRVGDYFVRTQQPDGRWVDDRFKPSTLGQDIALTDQQAMWLTEVIEAVACSQMQEKHPPGESAQAGLQQRVT